MVIYPNSGVLWGAGLLQTALANAEIHLYQDGMGVVLSNATTLAELAAAEADFTGYAPVTITAWQDPLLNPLGGAGTDSGLHQFAAGAPYTVANVIKGGWIETAGGVLVTAWDYDAPRSISGPGDGVPVDMILVFG